LQYYENISVLNFFVIPQKLTLTSPTSGGRSVGIVRSRIQPTAFFFPMSCYFLLFGHEPQLFSELSVLHIAPSGKGPLSGTPEVLRNGSVKLTSVDLYKKSVVRNIFCFVLICTFKIKFIHFSKFRILCQIPIVHRMNLLKKTPRSLSLGHALA
jgi:hypothetical protein